MASNMKRKNGIFTSPYARFSIISLLGILLLTYYFHAWVTSVFLSYIIAVNIITFLLYGYDKWVAGSSFTRLPEKVLHGLAVLGGSPAALLAQKIFRHKTVKKSFQVVYWLIVVVQLVGLIWYFWPSNIAK